MFRSTPDWRGSVPLAIAFGYRSSARTHALTLHTLSALYLFALEKREPDAKTIGEVAVKSKAARMPNSNICFRGDGRLRSSS